MKMKINKKNPNFIKKFRFYFDELKFKKDYLPFEIWNHACFFTRL